MSIAVMPPPMTTIRRPTGMAERSFVWRSRAMKSTASIDAARALASKAELVDAGETHAEEHGVEIAPQLGSVTGRRPAPARSRTLMPPIAEDEVHLAWAKSFVVLYAAMPYSFRPPSFAGLEHVTSWPSSASLWAQDRPAGPPPTTATLLPVAGSALEWLPARGEQRVGGVALQQTDLDRLAFGVLAHAGFLAQGLGGADAGAHAAHDVGGEDCFGRADAVAGRDLADEKRNVDGGGTGLLARRVEAEIAAVGLDPRLVLIERRMHVAEMGREFRGAQAPGRDTRRGAVGAHGSPPIPPDDQPGRVSRIPDRLVRLG